MYETLKKFKVFKKITILAIFSLSCIMSVSVQYLANAQNQEISKPVIFVYFERHNIRQSDSFKAEIRLLNNLSYEINNVVIKFNKPSFIKVSQPNAYTSQCKEPFEPSIDLLNLSPIQARSIASQNFCIHSIPEVELGDYNLAFVVEYSWIEDKKTRQSFVVAEKPISVKFFGSDSIAGIPLGIAGLIVPGLSCLLVLAWMKIPLIPSLPLDQKLIYSLLTSIVILTVGNRFYPVHSNVISVNILVILSLTGVAIGLIVGIFYWSVKAFETNERQKLEIKNEDIEPEDGDYYELLQKVISLTGKADCKNPKTIIQIANNGKFKGSLAANYTDKDYVLIGWFAIETLEKTNYIPRNWFEKINSSIRNCRINKMDLYVKEGKILDAIRLAHQCGFKIIGEEQIYFAEPKSDEYQTADTYVKKILKSEASVPLPSEDGDIPILSFVKSNNSS